MTLNSFCQLNGDDMFALTYQKGVVVGTRENTCFEMTLYRLFDFHIEIKRRKKSRTTYLAPIYHDVLLQPYLDQVDISKLL
jgi:hypothetical protein